MKTNLLLMMLFLVSSVAFAEKATLPPKMLDPNLPMDMAYGLIEQGDEDNANQYYPEHVAGDLKFTAEQLYTGGIAKIQHLKEFECKIKELIQMEKVRAAIGDSDKIKCYKNFINRFGTGCKTNWTFAEIYPIKDSDKDKFTKKYTCDGKVETKKYKKNDSETRVKAMYQSLYAKLIKQLVDRVKADPADKVGEYEMAATKQCKTGGIKLYRLPYVGFKAPSSCKISRSECKEHDECCSMYCNKSEGAEKGKCGAEVACYGLIESGKECGILTQGKINPYCKNPLILHQLEPSVYAQPPKNLKIEECIETDYNTSEISECTPIGIKPKANKPCCSDKKGNDGKCTTQMTCDACARGGTRVGPNEKCCKGYYRSLRGICIQDFPPLILPETTSTEPLKKKRKKQQSFLKKIWDIIIPSAYADDASNCIAGVNCTNHLTAEQQESIDLSTKGCVEPDAHGELPTQAEIDTCLAGVEDIKNGFINENLTNGVEGEIWDKEKYLAQYNMTAITTKTGSDFKKCEFHSFNDHWKSAEPSERNAEIVIRGFEYVFSGSGTIDFWLDKNGNSIYDRAKEIATTIRKYRTQSIKNYLEIDRKMNCLCIATLGPVNFPDKMAFFNSSCEKEKAELSVSLKGADGTSSNENLSKVEKDQARTSEVDLGASGISHEKLLMEHLDMRMNTQFKKFDTSTELEKKLNELSQFIIDNQWEQSWDKSETLFDFTVKRTSGWVSWAVLIVIIIVAIVLSIVSFGSLTVVNAILVGFAVGALVGGVTAVAIEGGRTKAEERVKEFAQSAALKSIWGQGTNRHLDDEIINDWHKSCKTICFTEHKDLRRKYIGPYFDTTHVNAKMGVTSVEAKKRCKIHASSTVCFRNVHITEYEGEGRFLLDAKFPEFVSDNAYQRNTGFIEKVNEAYDRGITALKEFAPSKPKKTKWLEEDLLSDDKVYKEFLIDKGSWMPDIFTAAKEDKFKAGVKKYAECINLKKCGAKYLGEGEDDAYGYASLFENSSDIKNFADYVYQHHFKWPSLSASNVMRYPTMAMSSYFEAMVLNLKIISSLAAHRGLEMGDLFDKYKSDWDKRKKDYAIGASAQMGGKSGNSKYSKKFRMNFKRLNFKTGVGVGDFQGKNGEIIGTKGFNKNELSAFNNGVEKALRAADHTKKLAHYMATVGKTKRGKIKMNAQKKWAENFLSPLNKMPLSFGGKQFGMLRKTNNVTNNYGSDAHKGKVASYTPPKYDFSSDFSTPRSSGGGVSSSSGTVPKHGFKAPDNSYLLENAAKNQAMFERDDSDSLFKIVSKAYYRNLSLILVKQDAKSKESGIGELELKSQKTINKGKKDELKQLLEN